jgi:hypothetical protein
MDKKKAKEALLQGGGDSCVEALDHLWAKMKRVWCKERTEERGEEQKKEERYNQSYVLDKERLELEKRRVQAEEARAANEAKSLEFHYKRRLDEEIIMTVDIPSMPLSQQKSLQDEIIARRDSN